MKLGNGHGCPQRALVVFLGNNLISPGGSHAFLPAGKKTQVTGLKLGKSSGHRAKVNYTKSLLALTSIQNRVLA